VLQTTVTDAREQNNTGPYTMCRRESNNNNQNNNYVYVGVIMTAVVHPVHMMNAD